jgi:osmoprotectant transport system ATP-binding protein
MQPVSQDYDYRSEHAIAPDDNLRHALSLLLRTGIPKLTVVDGITVVGELTLEHIRDSARTGIKGDKAFL